MSDRSTPGALHRPTAPWPSSSRSAAHGWPTSADEEREELLAGLEADLTELARRAAASTAGSATRRRTPPSCAPPPVWPRGAAARRCPGSVDRDGVERLLARLRALGERLARPGRRAGVGAAGRRSGRPGGCCAPGWPSSCSTRRLGPTELRSPLLPSLGHARRCGVAVLAGRRRGQRAHRRRVACLAAALAARATGTLRRAWSTNVLAAVRRPPAVLSGYPGAWDSHRLPPARSTGDGRRGTPTGPG